MYAKKIKEEKKYFKDVFQKQDILSSKCYFPTPGCSTCSNLLYKGFCNSYGSLREVLHTGHYKLQHVQPDFTAAHNTKAPPVSNAAVQLSERKRAIKELNAGFCSTTECRWNGCLANREKQNSEEITPPLLSPNCVERQLMGKYQEKPFLWVRQ